MRRGLFILLLLPVAFLAGFLMFALEAERFESLAASRADGVVVLTGGGERIDIGAQLVTQQRGRRLLISGVNEKVTREDMLGRYPQLRAIEVCCLDLGYRARNTVGNALEASEWAARHGYRSLILVTAASHMPRAVADVWRAIGRDTRIGSNQSEVWRFASGQAMSIARIQDDRLLRVP